MTQEHSSVTRGYLVAVKMKKTILLGIVFLFLLNIVSAVNECGTQINSDTDCRITTPSNIICSTPTYTIYNQAGAKEVDNGAMTELASSSGVYYTTFNEDALGVYTIVICNNLSTAHLTVINTTLSDPLFGYAQDILNQVNVLNGTVININATIENINGTLLNNLNNTLNAELSKISSENNNSNQIYLFLFLLGLVFVIIGYLVDDNYIKTISGMIFTAIGIYIIRYGFYNISNDFIKYALSIICMGLGFYLMIKHALIIAEESLR